MHYHVDVFAGPETRYVRGLLLVREEDERWSIVDDFGLVVEQSGLPATGLELPEAMRQALVLVRATVGRDVRPVWGTAPYELLGYTAPIVTRALRIGPLRLRWPLPRSQRTSTEPVGEDGLPLPRDGGERG